MKKSDILTKVECVLLRQNASWKDYANLAELAWQNRVASVCVPPSRVKFMQKQLGGRVPICTMVGSPCGHSTPETKCWEAQQAILHGAKEIDMVIDIGVAANAVSDDDWEYVKDEIRQMRKICCGDIVLKVIIETFFLDEAKKITLCMMLGDLGADYLSTSTGLAPEGANLDDMELFRSYLDKRVKIKVAGGVSTIEEAKQFIEAGCSRIGSTNVVRLLNEVDGDEV